MNEIKVNVVKYPDRKNLMMRFVDPITGKQSARSTRTTNKRGAERAAAKWEAELQEGRYRPDSRITWDEFRERYEDEKLSGLSDNTAEAAATVFMHIEQIIAPKYLASLTPETLSRFQAGLRKTGMKETSIGAYLGHLRPALSWAKKMRLIGEVPFIEMPRQAKGRKLMRGRPITLEEFERMQAVIPAIRKRDSPVWTRYLNGLWLSGLRLEESLIASWDDDSDISVDLSGRHPRLRIYAEGEKGRRDRLLPIAPDFAEFLLETPEDERTGLVFQLGQRAQLSIKRVSRQISEIGRQANVVVNKDEGKFASAQDLRRAFGTRWSFKVKPVTLQLLMRHESIETTLKYYIAQDSDDIADELWKQHNSTKGNTLGNSVVVPTKPAESYAVETSRNPYV